ncbi:fungal-specific transcription factor domain-containing protein [Xylariaceae sp. FL0804]|nr:fungal-specific transcription factor domain-containing protein [Xylariaceae sp. FL0804]
MASLLPMPSGKPTRVLACVLCQSRKIKCDRNSPCANCVKANVSCVPSTPAPARKRRRPNQDLQQRLARCEELLSEYATAKPEGQANEPRSIGESWKPTGKLVVDDGGDVKFMDSYLWANITDELSAMREILEEEESTRDEADTPADSKSPDANAALVLSHGAEANLEELHPKPAHVLRLWQTFLERVNPLTKVIHVPTVQPLLVEAATNRTNLPKNVEALLFAIYLMGTVALEESECVEQLGYSKAEAYNRFSQGCRTVLVRVGFLQASDLIVVQALVLYLYSLMGRYDRHAAWILNGVTVRIAQKMGLHRDGESLGLSPFDTEMRRRIWWQIIILDSMNALTSGIGPSLIPRTWDTKKPLNINDSDLYPKMTGLQAKDGPTDMIYCLTFYEIAELMVEAHNIEPLFFLHDKGPPGSTIAADLERAQRRIGELDKSMSNVFDSYGDLSMGPTHELAGQIRRTLMQKLREVIRPLNEQPEWGTEVLTAKDNLFKISVTSGEQTLQSYRMTEVRRLYMWNLRAHFQIEVLIFMVGQLACRTSGQLVERAWTVIEQFYHFQGELYDLSSKSHMALAIFTLRAWKIRVDALVGAGVVGSQTPGYILRLQELLPSEETKHIPSEAEPSLSSAGLPMSSIGVMGSGTALPGLDVPWDQMLGFVDTEPSDWDMQLAASFGGENGFGSNANGWM